MKTTAIDIRLIGKRRTGDEAVFFSLTKAIIALDDTNRYVLLTDNRSASECANIRHRLGADGRDNVEIVSLPVANRFMWNAWTIPLFLYRHRIDVFHTQYILPLSLPRRTKVITHIHDVSFRAFPKFIGWKDRLFLALFIPRSLRRSDRIVTPSVFTRDEVMKYYQGLSASEIAVIPNALGDAFLRMSTADEREAVRKKYRLPEKFIVSVGTMQPRKNIPALIRIFALIRERLPEYSLVLVGDSDGHNADPNVRAIIDELGIASSVIFTGYVDENDLPALIGSAAAFVFPSFYEGFGVPLLEAMSQDVPVVASDIPVFHEVAGDAAAFIDTDNLVRSAEIVYTLLVTETLQKRLIEAGRERLTKFSWEQSARVLRSLYEEC